MSTAGELLPYSPPRLAVYGDVTLLTRGQGGSYCDNDANHAFSRPPDERDKTDPGKCP